MDDYLIVGSGLTGAVIARALSDAGHSVLVLERRPHVGGNVHEQTHDSGIAFHTYGPHYFRTNSEKLWAYVHRFAKFRPFEAVLKSLVDGRYENWPIAGSYIRRTANGWAPSPAGTPANFEEASLAMMPRVVYEKFVKGYTEKQWGVPATALSASLAKRFDVREDDEPRQAEISRPATRARLSARLAMGPALRPAQQSRSRQRPAHPHHRMEAFDGARRAGQSHRHAADARDHGDAGRSR